MKVIVLLLSLCLFILSIDAHASDASLRWFSVSAQQDTVLQMGQIVPRELTRDEVQTYYIDLTTNQYAQVSVDWDGLDLSVVIADPEGKKVYASPINIVAPGPGTVGILAQSSGRYRLLVTTTTKYKITGKYQIRLAEIRNATNRDQVSTSAQRLLTEAQNDSTTDALKKYEQALSLWQSIHDFDGEAQTLFLLGAAYRSRRMWEEAKASYTKAGEVWHTVRYSRGEGYAKLNLGNVRRASGSAKDAIADLEESQKSFTEVDDKRGEASSLYSQAYAHMSIGQTPEAIKKLNTALQIRLTEGDSIGIANVLNVLADANRIMGNFEVSLELYRQATDHLKGLDYPLLETSILNGTVLVYNDLGEFQRARDGYTSALISFETLLGSNGLNTCYSTPSNQFLETCRSVANVLDNLGEAYNSLGDTDQALTELNKSLIIRDILNEPGGQGSTRFHIGYAYYLQGDLTKALEYYNAALLYQQRADDDKGICVTYTYMGMAYALKQPNKALELYRKAIPVEDRSGDKRAQAITLDKIGQLFSILGNPNESERAFSSALTLWRLVKDVDGEALTLHNLANAYRTVGEFERANEFSETAIKLIENLRTRVTSQRLRAFYLADKENYYDLDVDLKMQLSKVEKRNDHLAAAFESSEKARARVLLDSLNEAGVDRSLTPQSADPRFSSLIEQKLKLLSALANKAQVRTKFLNGPHSPAQIANLDRELSDLNGKYDNLETEIRSQNPHFATLTKSTPAKLAEIQKQLDDDTLIVEFLLAEPRSYAWVVGNNSIEGVELPTQQDIESLAKRVSISLSERGRTEKNESDLHREQRIKRAESDYREASSLFSKNVLTPLVPLLTKKRLVIVADGALQLLPFGALPFPNQLNNAGTRSPQMLIEQHEIVSLPSASVLVLQRHELSDRKPAPYALAVIADPVFGENDPRVTAARRSKDQKPNGTPKTIPGGTDDRSRGNETGRLTRALGDVGIDSVFEIRRLPFSFREAKEILKTVPVSQSFSALDFNANRATVMSPKLAHYRIVHLATHGVMDLKHPELSGILLSMIDENGKEQNGYLGLNEIYDLKWPAELVVLSACETGIGKEIKGEGLIALTRGFMYAGAARVVASLWKVNDRATAELMAEFYCEMLVNRTTPAAALRLAQLKLSKHPRWQNPHFWAGFVLQGEWR